MIKLFLFTYIYQRIVLLSTIDCHTKSLKKIKKINQRNDFEGAFTVGYYVTEDN